MSSLLRGTQVAGDIQNQSYLVCECTWRDANSNNIGTKGPWDQRIGCESRKIHRPYWNFRKFEVCVTNVVTKIAKVKGMVETLLDLYFCVYLKYLVQAVGKYSQISEKM